MAPTARGPRPHTPTGRSYFEWTVDDLPGAETTSPAVSLGDAQASAPTEGVRTAA